MTLSRRHDRGVALVLTLIVLVIISIVIVAFFSVVSYDRQATTNYDSSLNAEQITLGGVDQVIAQMRAQIFDAAFSTPNGSGTNILYVPIAGTNAVPQQVVANPNLPTVLTASGLPAYNSANTGGANLASACYTTNFSQNRRNVPMSQWEAPELVPAAQAGNLPVPQWILVTRNGPQQFTSYDPSLASNALANGNYALGRYAYVVYDTSGLLDINVAGYPSSAASSATTKGSLAWADLTQLGISQTDVDSFIAWRNPATMANSSYATNVALAGTNGYMHVATGDTTLLSRQELIQYAQQHGNNWTSALPYLTTFSRELNGPTWKPTTNFAAPYNYISHEYQPTDSGGTLYDNVFIANPRVQTAFIRDNGVPAVVGEPLVKYRFPLQMLSLLEKEGSTQWGGNGGKLSASDQQLVAQYFGLDLASDSSGLYRHWTYPTTNSSYPHTKGRILTLDEVAALVPAREPDFFELLQAGILQGSVGYTPTNADGSERGDFRLTGSSSTRLDIGTSITAQIMQIGANIIDQFDADNYPTDLSFLINSTTSADFYGVEDLPYINEYFVKPYGTSTAGYTIYSYCELWNPHAYTGADPSLYPTSFEIVPESVGAGDGDSYQLQLVGRSAAGGASIFTYNGTAWSLTNQRQFLGNIAGGGAVTFGTTPATSYREPSLINGGTAVGPPAGDAVTTPTWSPSPSTIGCWILSSLPIPPGTMAPNGGTSGTSPPATWALATSYSICYNFVATLALKYRDPSGNYHTYATFMGLDVPGLETGYLATAYDSAPNNNDPSYNAWSFPKSDPRTSRYGSMGTTTTTAAAPTSANVGLTPVECISTATLNSPTYNNPPFYGPGSNVSILPNYRLDLWSVNNPAVAPQGPVPTPTTTYSSYYPDSDGAYRFGDATYSYPTGSPLYTGANNNRPVILNRPFQSVGELGYVFRDSPWKTLDFFTPSSGDAALLDLFTTDDAAPVTAGRVNPNTPYPQVLAALISGAMQSDFSSTTVSSGVATAAATAIVNASRANPLMNRADLVNLAMGSVGSQISTIKSEREAVIRGVADSANTRTWNLLIDIVGQVGRFPPTATDLDQFVVTGQRHYWLHVAIDRYTGAVVDKQLEVVNQ